MRLHLHRWALVSESAPGHEVEFNPDGSTRKLHETVARRWYCSRCRTFDVQIVRKEDTK